MKTREKTIIITGGSGALGKVVARRFLDEDFNIVLPVRSLPLAKSHADSLDNSQERIQLVEGDLTLEPDVARIVEKTLDRFKAIDALANIAGGYAGGKPIADVSLGEYESMLDRNLRTAFLMSRAVLAPMLAQDSGRIVSITAMPALTSGAKKGPYAISKRGVIALTEVIADEVRGTGVTANAIAPGIITTEANRSSMPEADIRKWVTPEEVAGVILFLCSEEARSVNGTVVKMFGGL